MALDWIKMSTELDSDPRVQAIAAALTWDVDFVIGKLHHLWRHFDKHSVDGFVPYMTPAVLDRMLNAPGIADALLAVDWLEVRPDGLALPRFEKHNGETSKRRALDARRKFHSRHGGAEPNDDPGSAKAPQGRVSEKRPQKRGQVQDKSRTPGGRRAPVAGLCADQEQEQEQEDLVTSGSTQQRNVPRSIEPLKRVPIRKGKAEADQPIGLNAEQRRQYDELRALTRETDRVGYYCKIVRRLSHQGVQCVISALRDALSDPGRSVRSAGAILTEIAHDRAELEGVVIFEGRAA